MRDMVVTTGVWGESNEPQFVVPVDEDTDPAVYEMTDEEATLAEN
jgi:hypothetical protein